MLGFLTLKGASGVSTRDEAFTQSFGTPPPTISNQQLAPQQFHINPNVTAGRAAIGVPNYYIPINAEIAKSYVIPPTNQGQIAAIAQRRSMMYDPRNSPSRSQFSQGYTDPLQYFSAGNTWNQDSGLSSKGQRLRQPSTKAVSPFANLPIPTRMPWDL